ncbi:MAG: sugar phosphate isomerase/epimerase [Proteobacteria bacterium]|nr:sugar phosphate isomerase/epimerase [Pseudomonadota bacterium]
MIAGSYRISPYAIRTSSVPSSKSAAFLAQINSVPGSAAGEARELRVRSARHGVSLSIHFPTRFFPGSCDDSMRLECVRQLRATIGVARDIGARVIVVHPGPVGPPDEVTEEPAEDDRAQARKRAAESVRQVAGDAEDAGIMLCLENLPFDTGMAVRSYAEQVDLVRSVDSPAVALTLDAGHAFRSGGIAEAFGAFGPWLRHFHIHDATESRPHLELGAGAIDFAAHAGLLRAYPHTMIMEINVDGEGQTSPARGRTKPALLRSRDILRDLLGNAI